MTALRRPPVGRVRFGDLRRVTPIARRFGFDRGLLVDRHYIEGFLRRHALAVKGHVLEIGGNDYTRAFGGGRVETSDVLDVSPENDRATVIADLAQAPQIASETFDCIICTQTLQLIYDVKAAVATLHRILKPGGTILATFPGISQTDDDTWAPTWYWSFTPVSAERMFGEAFDGGRVAVAAHGNVLAATAFLHGLSTSDVRPGELDHDDPIFPFVVSVLAVKASVESSSDADVEQAVSVVIPCFNQAEFLGEAVESVLQQTRRPLDVIVVDDGSTDDTASVCRRYPAVRYIHQANEGLAKARNAGLMAATGTYLVFLDADDRLHSGAVDIGVRLLQEHPEWAFVSGEHRDISPTGSVQKEWTRQPVTADHYLALLRSNYVGMVATVMYRRQVFEDVGGFDATLSACEDYDLYLRVARRFPIGNHDQLVADYRRHDRAMSTDVGKMLTAALTVLRSQRPFVTGNPDREAAFAAGMAFWRSYYGGVLASRLFGRLPGNVRSWVLLMRLAPAEILTGVRALLTRRQ